MKKNKNYTFFLKKAIEAHATYSIESHESFVSKHTFIMWQTSAAQVQPSCEGFVANFETSLCPFMSDDT